MLVENEWFLILYECNSYQLVVIEIFVQRNAYKLSRYSYRYDELRLWNQSCSLAEFR